MEKLVFQYGICIRRCRILGFTCVNSVGRYYVFHSVEKDVEKRGILPHCWWEFNWYNGMEKSMQVP